MLRNTTVVFTTFLVYRIKERETTNNGHKFLQIFMPGVEILTMKFVGKVKVIG